MANLAEKGDKRVDSEREVVQHLLTHLGDAAVLVDKNQNIVEFNQAAEKIFDIKRSTVLNRPLDQLIPFRYRATHRRQVDKFTNESQPHMEAMLDRNDNGVAALRRDGVEIALDSSVSKVILDGEPHLLSVLRDVSEKRREEISVRESQRMYEAVMQQSSDAILLVDLDTRRILEVNDAATNLLGYSVNELKNMTILDVAPLDKDVVQQNLKKLKYGPHRILGERRYLAKDRSVRDVEVSATKITFCGREVANIIARDMTERKREEKEMKESRRRYALAAKGSSDVLWEWNIEDGAIVFSDFWMDVIEKKEMTSVEWRSLIHPEDLEMLDNSTDTYLRGIGERMLCECRVTNSKRSKYIWVEIRAVACSDGTGKKIQLVGTLRDISKQRAKHEELQRLAYTDNLTGLHNRTAFISELNKMLRTVDRESRIGYFVILIDINRLKDINDRYGHYSGDSILVELADRLKSIAGKNSCVNRITGDEFAILYRPQDDEIQASAMVSEIHRVTEMPFNVASSTVQMTATVGIIEDLKRYVSGDEILRDAANAVHHGKAAHLNDQWQNKRNLSRSDDVFEIGQKLLAGLNRDWIDVVNLQIEDTKSSAVLGSYAELMLNCPDGRTVYWSEMKTAASNLGVVADCEKILVTRALNNFLTEIATSSGNRLHVPVSEEIFFEFDFELQFGSDRSWNENESKTLVLGIDGSVLSRGSEKLISRCEYLKKIGIEFEIMGFGSTDSPLKMIELIPAKYIEISSDLTVSGNRQEYNILLESVVSLVKEFGRVPLGRADNISHLRSLNDAGVCEIVKSRDSLKLQLVLS